MRVKGDCFVLKKQSNTIPLFLMFAERRNGGQPRGLRLCMTIIGRSGCNWEAVKTCNFCQKILHPLQSWIAGGMKSLSAVGCRLSEKEGRSIPLSKHATFGVKSCRVLYTLYRASMRRPLQGVDAPGGEDRRVDRCYVVARRLAALPGPRREAISLLA